MYLISVNNDIQWCFSQVKGTLEDDATEGNVSFRNNFGIRKRM